MQVNKKYIYASKNHPFTCFPAAEHHNTVNLALREKPVDFLYGAARTSALAPEIILLTQVPLQKFPFL